jgi:hypothetical protein
MGDIGDQWKAIKADQAIHRENQRVATQQRLPVWIARLQDAGLTVHRFSEEHMRIGGVIDWWPSTGTWMECQQRQLRGKGFESMFRAAIQLKSESV